MGNVKSFMYGLEFYFLAKVRRCKNNFHLIHDFTYCNLTILATILVAIFFSIQPLKIRLPRPRFSLLAGSNLYRNTN